MFKVTPNRTLHGKKLKMFYRTCYHIIGHEYPSHLPANWCNHPFIMLNQAQLDRLFNFMSERYRKV